MKTLSSSASSSYVRVAPLARGGMGSVELVMRREGEFRRLYARKRPLEKAAHLREGFLREATLAGLLRHPNVVSVLDVGEDTDGPYLLMDFVDGLSLSKVIGAFHARGELIPLQVCLTMAKQIAEGLHAAHELRDHDGAPVSLVHRDVSPQNVLLDYEGIVRVTDFGLAKALGRVEESSADALKGKIGYMSPEQLRFERLDRRSDLWALGVVLYELLACRRLHGSASDGVEHVARQILDDPPPDIEAVRDDAPPALTELLWDLLAKRREDRPSSGAEVAARLGAILREVERDDGAIELRAFALEHFAEARAEARTRRAAAIARAETEADTPEAPRRRWWPAAAALVVLVIAGWWAAPGEEAVGLARPAAADPVTESVAETESEAESVAESEAESESVAETESVVAETESVAEPEPVAESGGAAGSGEEAVAARPGETGAEGEAARGRRPGRRGGRRAAREEGQLWEWP